MRVGLGGGWPNEYDQGITIMRLIYLILICFAAPVAALTAWWRGLRDPARRESLADRLGRPTVQFAEPVIWVHAASMGEVQAAAVLVRTLQARYANYQILVTTMTTTGAARVKALFPERVTHCYLPYDLPWAVRAFLRRVSPKLGIVMETELWPNLLRACRERDIAMIVASARISPRTASRYRRFAGLFRDVMSHGVHVAAQTPEDAQRFADLGARKVQVTGNIKFDIDIPAAVLENGRQLRALFADRFVWVAGSTHATEEEAALNAHRALLRILPNALLIIVPRHPQRFEEVRALLAKSELPFTTWAQRAASVAASQVLFVDTMGELLNCYAAANLTFVGGSLAKVGGHNLLEPAALGVTVLCGPHMSSQQEIVDRLLSASAVLMVHTADELASTVVRLASDPSVRERLGAQAQQVVAGNRGATERTMAVIEPQLRAEKQNHFQTQ
jgi:3-deoxy-D-manno-octulosonic-acid transferase